MSLIGGWVISLKEIKLILEVDDSYLDDIVAYFNDIYDQEMIRNWSFIVSDVKEEKDE